MTHPDQPTEPARHAAIPLPVQIEAATAAKAVLASDGVVVAIEAALAVLAEHGLVLRVDAPAEGDPLARYSTPAKPVDGGEDRG